MNEIEKASVYDMRTLFDWGEEKLRMKNSECRILVPPLEIRKRRIFYKWDCQGSCTAYNALITYHLYVSHSKKADHLSALLVCDLKRG